MLLSLLGIEPQINVGFVPDIAPANKAGVARFEVPGKGMVTSPFLIDKPEKLSRPSPDVINAIFDQILKMGFFPDKLEILSKDEYLVYAYGQSQPIVRQVRVE